MFWIEKSNPQNWSWKFIILFSPTIIGKITFIIPTIFKLFFELNDLLDDNTGGSAVEIELPEENSILENSNWLWEEVTRQIKYYNTTLS